MLRRGAKENSVSPSLICPPGNSIIFSVAFSLYYLFACNLTSLIDFQTVLGDFVTFDLSISFVIHSDLFPDTTVTCIIAAHGSITAAEYNGNALSVSGIATDWSAENRVTFETTR